MQERVCTLFKSCHERFTAEISHEKRKRKFFSYLLFIEQVLTFLGVPNVQHHFKPLKNVRNARRQTAEIQRMLRSDNVS